MNNWLPEWFKISYEEAKEFLFSPIKWSIVKPFQLLLQIPFLLLAGIFMLIILLAKNIANFITQGNKGLFWIVKIIQRIRKYIK